MLMNEVKEAARSVFEAGGCSASDQRRDFQPKHLQDELISYYKPSATLISS
jgi:hypothetical protein